MISQSEGMPYLTENESDNRPNRIHDRRIKRIMTIKDLIAIEQLEPFLAVSQAVAFLVALTNERVLSGYTAHAD
jgi:hypothetical protein